MFETASLHALLHSEESERRRGFAASYKRRAERSDRLTLNRPIDLDKAQLKEMRNFDPDILRTSAFCPAAFNLSPRRRLPAASLNDEQRLGRPHVDDQIEFGRLHHR